MGNLIEKNPGGGKLIVIWFIVYDFEIHNKFKSSEYPCLRLANITMCDGIKRFLWSSKATKSTAENIIWIFTDYTMRSSFIYELDTGVIFVRIIACNQGDNIFFMAIRQHFPLR